MGSSKGMLMLVSSVLFFSLMASLVRLVPDISSTYTVFYRFMFNVAIMGILALFKVFPLKFVRSPLLLLRGLTGGIATYLFYLSIVKLGVGKGTVISYSYPVFAAVFSVLFLKEKISVGKWIVISIAFVGILLLSFSKTGISNGVGWFEALALLGAVLAAFSITLVKKLHATDSTYAIFFAQAIVGFWIFVGPASTILIETTWVQFSILLGIGITAAAAQLIMTAAYKRVNVSTGASFFMLVPVLNILIGFLFFKEILSISEIIGATVVVSACIVLAKMR